MGTTGAEAESMTEDIVPDARAGASVEKSVEALAVVCSAAGVKLGGYGVRYWEKASD